MMERLFHGVGHREGGGSKTQRTKEGAVSGPKQERKTFPHQSINILEENWGGKT